MVTCSGLPRASEAYSAGVSKSSEWAERCELSGCGAVGPGELSARWIMMCRGTGACRGGCSSSSSSGLEASKWGGGMGWGMG